MTATAADFFATSCDRRPDKRFVPIIRSNLAHKYAKNREFPRRRFIGPKPDAFHNDLRAAHIFIEALVKVEPTVKVPLTVKEGISSLTNRLGEAKACAAPGRTTHPAALLEQPR